MKFFFENDDEYSTQTISLVLMATFMPLLLIESCQPVPNQYCYTDRTNCENDWTSSSCQTQSDSQCPVYARGGVARYNTSGGNMGTHYPTHHTTIRRGGFGGTGMGFHFGG